MQAFPMRSTGYFLSFPAHRNTSGLVDCFFEKAEWEGLLPICSSSLGCSGFFLYYSQIKAQNQSLTTYQVYLWIPCLSILLYLPLLTHKMCILFTLFNCFCGCCFPSILSITLNDKFYVNSKLLLLEFPVLVKYIFTI